MQSIILGILLIIASIFSVAITATISFFFSRKVFIKRDKKEDEASDSSEDNSNWDDEDDDW